MLISRRQFVSISIATSTAVALLGAGTIWSWWDIPPSESFATLHENEARILRNISAAAFPGGEAITLDGKQARLDRFFDGLLQAMPDENRKLLKLLINGIDNLTLATHYSSYTSLDDQVQRQVLTGWLSNDNHLFRGAIQSLVLLLGMGYTAHPDVAPTLSKYFKCGFGA